MADELHWVSFDGSGRLATMPRPRGNDWLMRDLMRFQGQGVTGLVSLLERHEEVELELESEGESCGELGLSFHTFPIPDRGVPRDEATFWSVAQELNRLVSEGGALAVHCRAGIGRATLMAGAVLVHSGVEAEAALGRIQDARGRPVPDTTEQRAWFLRSAVAMGGTQPS